MNRYINGKEQPLQDAFIEVVGDVVKEVTEDVVKNSALQSVNQLQSTIQALQQTSDSSIRNLEKNLQATANTFTKDSTELLTRISHSSQQLTSLINETETKYQFVADKTDQVSDSLKNFDQHINDWQKKQAELTYFSQAKIEESKQILSNIYNQVRADITYNRETYQYLTNFCQKSASQFSAHNDNLTNLNKSISLMVFEQKNALQRMEELGTNTNAQVSARIQNGMSQLNNKLDRELTAHKKFIANSITDMMSLSKKWRDKEDSRIKMLQGLIVFSLIINIGSIAYILYKGLI